MKRFVVIAVLFSMMAIPLMATGTTEADAAEEKTVDLFISGKAVWGEPMNTVVAAFTEAYPNISVEVEVVGGGTDYHPVLASRARTRSLPDIFMISGVGDFVVYEEFLADLSDMDVLDHMLPAVEQAAYHDGKLMGLPVSIEGYGYIYNKDLFAQAGIAEVPQTFGELEAAAAKLQAAGITPFVSGYNTWWVIANHQFNIPFAMQDDPMGFLDDLAAGTSGMRGNEHFENLERLIRLVMENSANPPLTEDHNMQVSLFASEEAAMIQQGNWKEAAIMDANPDINMGLLPIATGDDPATSGRVPVGVPWYWVVTEYSEELEEAKTFLNWLNNEPGGQEQFVTSLNSMPAYDHFDADFPGGITNDILAYSAQEGKTMPWIFTLWPQGYPQDVAEILQEFVAARIDFDEALTRLEDRYRALLED